MKTTLIFAIIIGVAGNLVIAQEGCLGGPVFVIGSTSGACNCSLTAPNCTGSVTIRDSYTKCGGSGFTYCYPRTQTVGRSSIPCVETVDYGAYVTAYQAWRDCLIDANRNHPFPIQCKEPDYCDWHFCNVSTTGGTSITAPVLYDIGEACSSGGVAKLWCKPSSSSFFAGLLSAG